MHILIKKDNKIIRESFTNKRGLFTITDIIPGNYTILIDSKYFPQRGYLTTTSSIDIILKPGQLMENILFGIAIKEKTIITTFRKTADPNKNDINPENIIQTPTTPAISPAISKPADIIPAPTEISEPKKEEENKQKKEEIKKIFTNDFINKEIEKYQKEIKDWNAILDKTQSEWEKTSIRTKINYASDKLHLYEEIKFWKEVLEDAVSGWEEQLAIDNIEKIKNKL